MKLGRILALLLFMFPNSAVAQKMANYNNLVVTHIYDGDSIRAKSGNQEIEIRLASIDAPEFNQNYGIKCRALLQRKINGAHVRIEPIEKDKYGRIIANVYLGVRNINREQVAEGCAWAYRRYLHDNAMMGLEQSARRAKLGLWSQKQSAIMPPWIERHNRN